MFKLKFPTKRIFRIFPVLRINGMVLFYNLFIEHTRLSNMWTILKTNNAKVDELKSYQ